MNKLDFDNMKKMAKKAYAPYSNFHVVAYFEDENGYFFSGVNVENAAYPNTMCAERVGIFSAINNGLDVRKTKKVSIYSPDSKKFLSPCGGCLQTMSEHLNKDVEIIMFNNSGECISKKFHEILPMPIDPKNIKGAK